VKMTERQRKLHGKRKQRQPRAMSDVRPEPLHAETGLTPDPAKIPVFPAVWRQNRKPCPKASTAV
jgi:hypothetical protein